jgi:glucan phosphoethanolaminetransferase (alkaline phosphatase superfamily)
MVMSKGFKIYLGLTLLNAIFVFVLFNLASLIRVILNNNLSLPVLVLTITLTIIASVILYILMVIIRAGERK